MMKRTLLIFALASLCARSVFSLDSSGKVSKAADFSLSAGGRIFYNGMFDIFEYSYTYMGYEDPNQNTTAVLDESLHSNHGFGIGGFFDATYVEVGLDFIFGTFTPIVDGYTGDFEMKSTQFGFSILGKYPVSLGQITVFPLAGIDYQMFISGEAGGYTIDRNDISGDGEGLFDAFSLVVGGGLDYRINAKLYLRGAFLVNFKMESDSDKALKRLARENDISFSLFTFGPRLSVGVGYKL